MTTTMTQPVLSAGTLTGDTVKNLQGEKLGTIKDLMIDTGSGRIAYAVLDFGGFLGIGGKLFAVPWSSFQVATAEKCLKLDTDKKMLEAAEGFDPDNWPDMADRTWGQKVHTHYGATPYWEHQF